MSLRHSPIVSVVMPSYNYEKFIGDAIASVLSQGMNFELLIVDDFSTDRSREIIRDWMKKDRRIKAMFHTSNLGIARTLNDGIRSSIGKYVALMSSDDMFRSGAFVSIVKVMENHLDCGVAVLEAECVDETNARLGFRFSDLYRKPSVFKGSYFRDLVKDNFICTGVIRRRILEDKAIFFDERLKYFNDWIFWLDLSCVTHFVYMNEPLYYYRIHRSSSSSVRSFDREIHEVILTRYADRLDAGARSLLFMKNGLVFGYATSTDFDRARRNFHDSIRTNPVITQKLLTFVLLALMRSPRLFKLVCLNLWQNRSLTRFRARRLRGRTAVSQSY